MPKFQIDGVFYDAPSYAEAKKAAGVTSKPLGATPGSAPSIVALWPERTGRVMRRSRELKLLDAALAKWADKGAGGADANLLAAGAALSDWQETNAAEANTLASEASELDAALGKKFASGKSQISNAMSTGVAPTGWTHVQWTQAMYPWTTAVSGPQKLSDSLSTAETMRVNESMRRARLAVTYARDAMIRIAGGGGSGSEKDTYRTFFGAADNARIQRARDNFNVLALAFERGPDVIDLRNTKYGLTCYAACFRNSLGTHLRKKGPLSLTGSVNMFLGREFFSAGNYEKTSDATVGTLVHEFAHGAINAVDVPPVDNAGAWTHTRVSDDPAHDEFGASTTNSIQASTIEMDTLLAEFKPEYAIVNADNYGQFATALLLLNKG